MNAVIVGGGIMGCSVALELRKKGLEVTVLERSVPGAEASSAAAGMLAPQLEGSGPGSFLDLCLRSRAMYPKWAAQLQTETGVDVGFLECGALKVAFDEAEVHGLDAQVAWQTASGLRAELLDGAEARRRVPALSEHALAAAWLPDDAQVDNTRLMRALTAAAQKAGARFRRGYVRGVLEKGGVATGVDLDGEALAAEAVVLAAGSWSGLVAGAHIDPRLVRPVRGQMAQVELRARPFEPLLFGRHGYVVPRADGRLLLGSTSEEAGFEKDVTLGGLHQVLGKALAIAPSLAEARVEATWAGLRPATADGLPVLGKGPLERLFLATGHFRNGILLAPMTARLIGQLVAGEPLAQPIDPFRYARLAL
jgi:glycine oxidase